VIGLGQPAAGDDGVGLEVVACLRRRGVPEGVELLMVPEPSALIPLLITSAPVVLVDAVLATSPGQVLTLTPGMLAERRPRPLSSHGLDLCQAVELARVVGGAAVSGCIRIVGVSIVRPRGVGYGLSPAVAAAVPGAAGRVLGLVGGEGAGMGTEADIRSGHGVRLAPNTMPPGSDRSTEPG
jgi:hydrogenase maturation protease